MKKYWLLWFAVLTMLVIVACENPMQASQPGRAEPLSHGRARGGGAIVPSGDLTGETDRIAIEAALLGCPPGGMVKLGKGHFYLDMPVVIEGFNGTLRGSGMNKTTVETAIGFEPTPLRILWDNPMAIMFGFFWPEDSVTVEDMTLQATNAPATVPYDSIFLGFQETTNLSNFVVIGSASPDSTSVTATCSDLRCVAAPSSINPLGGVCTVSVPIAICGGAPTTLDPDGLFNAGVPIYGRVEGCEIVYSGGPGIHYFKGGGGTMSVFDNTFTDCTIGVRLGELNDDCDIRVSFNTFLGTMGAFPIVVTPGSVATIAWNDYDDLVSCSNGYVVVLQSSGNEVYEDLSDRPDLSVAGDPNANVIVTDAKWVGRGRWISGSRRRR